ncbi:YSC84-related protein [Motilimonas sp. KMU-193]|uniref:lipid-binding SYLF domain-containing protein n=1 Tax=Motilimonas sp. KMU-193 TaxID=3388668 RepID=UPI00396B43DE
MNKIFLAVPLLLLSIFAVPSASAASVQEQRAEINTMAKEAMNHLYKAHPSAKKAINQSYGYAVFSNTGINLLLLSTARGGGVAIARASGKRTYMDMFSAGVGIGLGAKNYHGIFIFKTKSSFDNFVEHGWDFSGQADASAKKGEEGGAIDEALSINPDVLYYQLTQKGLALQATLQGTKYYKNDDLN